MNKKLFAMAFGLLASTSAYAAGDSAEAMEIARAQEACGEGLNDTIISAEYREDGKIGVRCARPAGAVLGAGAGAGTALLAGGTFSTVAAGSIFAVVLGAAAVGGSSSTSDTQ